MLLSDYIFHYFGGRQTAFAEAMGCNATAVSRWLRIGVVVENGEMYSPLGRKVPVVNRLPPPRREAFETQIRQVSPQTDLTRAGDHYADPKTQAVWAGWLMAQEDAAQRETQPQQR